MTLNRTFSAAAFLVAASTAISQAQLTTSTASQATVTTSSVPTLSGGVGAISGGIIGSLGPSGIQGIKGQPFSLVQETKTVRVLADGTTLTHVRQEKIARDSEGRTRNENDRTLDGAFKIEFININDPMAKTFTMISPTAKQATIHHMSEPRPLSEEDRKRLEETRAKAQAERAAHPDQPVPQRRPRTEVEKLGSRSIAGIYAEGTRLTHVIPAGQMGNDRELREVNETWTSPDLKIILERTVDSPINGKTITTVTELQRGEPDPALFRVPEGYKVVDQQPQLQTVP